MKKIFPLMLFGLFLIPTMSFAQNQLVTSNVLHRVFFIKYGNQVGTGFTIDIDNRQYLISAKHFLIKLKEVDSIEIFHEAKWKRIKVKRINLNNPKIDILVLATDVQLSPPLELRPSIDNIILSQDVFFLGFPFGMTIEAKEMNNYFPLPFVKKGIVSAMAFNNKEEKIIYVDGYNNPGFSGGPIIYFDRYKKRLSVAAVVSGYRNDISKIYDKNKATALKAVTNSGILIGYTIDAAVEAIKNNPIGIEIKGK